MATQPRRLTAKQNPATAMAGAMIVRGKIVHGKIGATVLASVTVMTAGGTTVLVKTVHLVKTAATARGMTVPVMSALGMTGLATKGPVKTDPATTGPAMNGLVRTVRQGNPAVIGRKAAAGIGGVRGSRGKIGLSAIPLP